MTMFTITSILRPRSRSCLPLVKSSASPKRYFSHGPGHGHGHGALAGGFTSEALQQWAIHHFNTDTNGKLKQNKREGKRENENENESIAYVDLFSEPISNECVTYLNNQKHPSSELVKSFFGSSQFLPQRMLITPFFEHSQLPDVFSLGTQYLPWTVAVQSPLETICTYERTFKFTNVKVRGCTMIAYDPKLRRVYHGNCIESSAATQSNIFRIMTPMHVKYARMLLSGMVQDIEAKSESMSV
jgi:hypothetical protein